MADKIYEIGFDADKFVTGVETALKELDKLEQGTAEFDAAMKKLQQTVNGVSFTKPIADLNQLKSILQQSNFKLNFDGVNRTIDEFAKDIPAMKKLLDDLKAKLNTTTDGTEFNELRQAIAQVENGIQQLGETTEQAGEAFVPLRKRIREGTVALQELENAGLENTERYRQLQREVAQLTDQLGDQRAAIRALASDTLKIDAGIQAIQGVTAAFQVYEGALAAVGVENEDLQKTQAKLMALMNIANGIQTIQNLLQKESTIRIVADNAAKVIAAAVTRIFAKATEEAAAAQVALKTAMASTPWGAVLAVIGAVAGAILVFTSSTEDAKKSTEDFTEAIEANARSIAFLIEKASQKAELEKLRVRERNGTAREEYEIERDFLIEKRKLLAQNLMDTKVYNEALAIINNDKEKTEKEKAKEKLDLQLRSNAEQLAYENIGFELQQLALNRQIEVNNLIKSAQEKRIEAEKQYYEILQALAKKNREAITQEQLLEADLNLNPPLVEQIKLIIANGDKYLTEVENYQKQYLDIQEKIDENNKEINRLNAEGATKAASELRAKTAVLKKEQDAVLKVLDKLPPFNKILEILEKSQQAALNKITENFEKAYTISINNLQNLYEDLNLQDAVKGLEDIADNYQRAISTIQLSRDKENIDALRAFKTRQKEINDLVEQGVLVDDNAWNNVIDQIEFINNAVIELEQNNAALIQKERNGQLTKAEQFAYNNYKVQEKSLLDQQVLLQKYLMEIGVKNDAYKQYNKKNEEQYGRDLVSIVQKYLRLINNARIAALEEERTINNISTETAIKNSENAVKEQQQLLNDLRKQGVISSRAYNRQLTDVENQETEKRKKIRLDNIDSQIAAINKELAIVTDAVKKAQLLKEKADLEGLKFDILTEDDKKKLEEDVDVINRLLGSIFGLESDDKRVARLREELNGAIRNTTELLREQAAAELRAADAAVEAQQKRVDEALKIAEAGNAKYLKEEQDRLDELENKREAAARRQLQIDAALRSSQILLALAQGIAKGINSAETAGGAAIGIATIVASIAAALAGGAALSQALQGPALYEGTDALGRKDVTGGTDKLERGRYKSGRDTIPAWLHEGEAVISSDKTSQYQPTIKAIRRGLIPHDVMNQFVNGYRNGINYTMIGDTAKATKTAAATDMAETNNRLKRLEGVLGSIETAIGGMKYNITMDADGFAASINTHIKKQNKIISA